MDEMVHILCRAREQEGILCVGIICSLGQQWVPGFDGGFNAEHTSTHGDLRAVTVTGYSWI